LMAGRTSLVGLSLLVIAVVVAIGSPPKNKDREPPPQPPSTSEKAEPLPSPPEPSVGKGVDSWKTKFKIKRATPVKDLRPGAPKARTAYPVYLGDDLSKVPELVFEAPPASKLSTKMWTKRIGHNLAKADHLNGRRRDGFVKSLIAERSDLAGLPFLL